MADNEAIVVEFFERMNDLARWPQTVEEYSTPDIVFEATGVPGYQGNDHGRAYLEQWHQIMADRGITGVTVEIRNSAAKDDVVFLERIDRFLASDGSVVFTAEINSVILMREGKIALTRDYFDPRAWLE